MVIVAFFALFMCIFVLIKCIKDVWNDNKKNKK